MKKNSLFDLSTLSLLASNIIAAYFAVTQGWQTGTLLFVFWGQSAAIGFFYYFKLKNVKLFSTDGLKINGKQAPATPGTKNTIANVFPIHYSAALFTYFINILIWYDIQWTYAVPSIVMFFINHGYSYYYHREDDSNSIWNIGKLMFFPYIRTIPMHVIVAGTALFSSLPTVAVITFLTLKTIMDVLLHLFEHKQTDKNPERVFEEGEGEESLEDQLSNL